MVVVRKRQSLKLNPPSVLNLNTNKLKLAKSPLFFFLVSHPPINLVLSHFTNELGFGKCVEWFGKILL